MEFAHIELQADDGEHEDGKEEQQPDLQQRDHGLHDGLQHHLQAWSRKTAQGVGEQGQPRGAASQGVPWGQNKQSSRAKWGALRSGCSVWKWGEGRPQVLSGQGMGRAREGRENSVSEESREP